VPRLRRFFCAQDLKREEQARSKQLDDHIRRVRKLEADHEAATGVRPLPLSPHIAVSLPPRPSLVHGVRGYRHAKVSLQARSPPTTSPKLSRSCPFAATGLCSPEESINDSSVAQLFVDGGGGYCFSGSPGSAPTLHPRIPWPLCRCRHMPLCSVRLPSPPPDRLARQMEEASQQQAVQQHHLAKVLAECETQPPPRR